MTTPAPARMAALAIAASRTAPLYRLEPPISAVYPYVPLLEKFGLAPKKPAASFSSSRKISSLRGFIPMSTLIFLFITSLARLKKCPGLKVPIEIVRSEYTQVKGLA